MGRRIIELVQVLVDRIEKNGYQQRAREDDIADVYKRLTEAEGWAKHWKQARQEAHEAGELMKAEIETLKGAMAADDQRLRDAEERVWPGVTWGCDAPDKLAEEILHLREQLDAANAAVTLQRAEIERLRAFVNLSRRLLSVNINYADVDRLRAGLAELDACTEPTPATEPVDAEGGQ